MMVDGGDTSLELRITTVEDAYKIMNDNPYLEAAFKDFIGLLMGQCETCLKTFIRGRKRLPSWWRPFTFWQDQNIALRIPTTGEHYMRLDAGNEMARLYREGGWKCKFSSSENEFGRHYVLQIWK